MIPLLGTSVLRLNTAIAASSFDEIVGKGAWQFVLIDNGSSDKTPEIIQEALTAYPGSQTVHVAEPNYGAALRAGIRLADGKFLHICDIEHWDTPFFHWAWAERNNHDLFIGSKRSDPTISSQPLLRRVLSWRMNALLQFLFGYMGTETHGPKLINLDRLRPLIDSCTSDRGQFDTEIALRTVQKEFRIAEAPIAFVETRPPRTKIIKKVGWNLVAFYRLRGVMRGLPYEGPVEFHQFSRSDVLRASQALHAQRRTEPIEAASKREASLS